MDRDRWNRIDEVFQAAVELRTEDRETYLERACAGDDDLRARVERLLELDRRPMRILERPLVEVAANVVRPEPELRVGSTLGDFEVLEPLGVGGMGEVYRARDARLGREVALKLLPAGFAASPERLARFRIEARAASALNHPNIVTVYEVGTSDGRQFIATELVQGETLRERMVAGRLKVEEAVDVAMQIASALAVAHASGIVHRDVKPENVMVRRDGIVKVLDFGVAKLGVGGEETDGAADERPTATQTATQPGALVGTASYMSPEQARGETVDARSDVFSFGAVFYELLTGEMAFGREGSVETLHAILHDEPAKLQALGRMVPAEVVRVVRRCLEKDPAGRYGNGSELAEALERVSRSRGAMPAQLGWRGSRRWALALACAVLLVVVGAWVRSSRRPAEPDPLPAMTVAPITGLAGQACNPSFSPDGRHIAFDYIADGEDPSHVYVTPVDGGAAKRLSTSPDLETSPVWSPDGQHIAFTRLSSTEREIIVVPAAGGPERTLLTAVNRRWSEWGCRLDWSPNGELIAYSDGDTPDGSNGLNLITLATGQTRPLVQKPEPTGSAQQPAFSPDGQMVAFVRQFSWLVDDLFVVPVAGGEPVRLTTDKHDIWGVTWTADGRSIVFSSDRGGTRGLWRIAATGGEPERLGVGSDGAFHPTISRQGQRLVYVNSFVQTSTWRVDLSDPPGTTGSRTKVLSAAARDQLPQISPDGRRIAFDSTRTGPCEIWTCESDGSNPLPLTTLRRPAVFGPHWSPDGRSIAFEARLDEQSDIYVIGADGGTPRRLTDDPADDENPTWSHDGGWIYFASSRGGERQIWKMPADGGEAVQVTRQPGGDTAFESSDGRSVVFANDRVGVWKKTVDGEEELVLPEVGVAYRLAVTDEGIYFIKDVGNGATIEFFSFATRRVTRIATMDKPPGLGLAVSPDGRWLLYTQTDVESQGLMLADNFR